LKDGSLPRIYRLLLGGESFNVQRPSLIANCHLFKEKQGPIEQPRYQVQSEVSRDSMRVFAHAFDSPDMVITVENAAELAQLCPEFQFVDLATRIEGWQRLQLHDQPRTKKHDCFKKSTARKSVSKHMRPVPDGDGLDSTLLRTPRTFEEILDWFAAHPVTPAESLLPSDCVIPG
jgi:hypothetical protein